jgi:hypothetical protein
MNAPARTLKGDNVRPALVSADQLARDFAHLEALAQAIEARAKTIPPVFEDDDDLALAQKLIADGREDAAKVDRARDAEKRPLLEAERVVQAWFKAIENRILAAKQAVEDGPVKSYLRRKEARERAAREAEAKRLQAEAHKREQEAIAAAAAEAPNLSDTATAAEAVVVGGPLPPRQRAASFAMSEAVRAQNLAEDAAVAATAKPAGLARTRTEAGTATLVDDWKFEIVNFDEIDMNKLRAHFSRGDVEKAIRRHVTLNKDKEPLAGVRVWNDPKPMMV